MATRATALCSCVESQVWKLAIVATLSAASGVVAVSDCIGGAIAASFIGNVATLWLLECKQVQLLLLSACMSTIARILGLSLVRGVGGIVIAGLIALSKFILPVVLVITRHWGDIIHIDSVRQA